MHILWNFLIRVERFFGRASWLPFLDLVKLYWFGQGFLVYSESKRLKLTVTDMQGFHYAYGFVVLVRFLSGSICMIVSALLFSSVPI